MGRRDAIGRGMQDEDIAIVGMSCLFPGADSPSAFWGNIVSKTDCITDAPPDWQPEFFYDEAGGEEDRSYTVRGGFLGSLARFNPLKFGVPPSSVDGSEPDHFLALRCASEALEDAGVPDIPINRDKTGVIIGRGLSLNRGWVSILERTFVVDQAVSLLRKLEPERSEAEWNALKAELKAHLPPASAETTPGLVPSVLVGRTAHRLNLRGPAFTVDAACASAMLAAHLGMRELRAGNCDAVLVGGSQISTPGPIHVLFCYLQSLSRTGVVAPFSAQATGTLLGQGCGMLLLKRRSDAERDGNRIYALLKAVGTSSDGREAGLLAPLTEGQQLAVQRAYEQSGISPATLELIEAHGTAIPLGDRTELESLKSCIPAEGNGQRIALGSVKSMIGHCLPAAAAASLIKTALALYHRVLPPTLHAEESHPELELDKTPFYLCAETRPWLHPDRATPRRAGINAFGFGGINGHAILEEYVTDESNLPRYERQWPAELVVVSAPDRQALLERSNGMASWLRQHSDVSLLDVAAASVEQNGSARLAIVARSHDELEKKLNHAAKLLGESERDRIQDRSGIFWYDTPLAESGRLAYVFPGEGGQYVGMMQDLCRHFPEVRREFDLAAAVLQQMGVQKPPNQVLFPQPPQEPHARQAIMQMGVAVAAITAVGRGFLELLRRLGVQPDSIVGHSTGEFSALRAAGAYRPRNEQEAIHSMMVGAESTRQTEDSQLVPKASLVSVGGADPSAVESVLAAADGRLVVAMDNCPHQIVLAGDERAISDAIEALRGKGGMCERLPWDRAYHTEAFEPIGAKFDQYYSKLGLRAPEIELWSCATAGVYPQDPQAVQELAVRQWHMKVRFRETVEAMYASGVRLFVELGPRGNLSSFIADTLSDRPHAAVPLDTPRRNDIEQLCHALGMLAAHGVQMDLPALFDRRRPTRLSLDEAPPPHDAAPVLPLELPPLAMSDEFVAKFRVAREPASDGRGPRRTPPPPAASVPTPQAPAAPAPVAATRAIDGGDEQRVAALSDFQDTMRMFLQVQQDLMLGSAGGNSATAVETAHAVQATTASVDTATEQPTGGWPFLERIVDHQPGSHLIAACTLDVEKHRFLQDHTFFGRGLSVHDPTLRAISVTPLAMTLEIMAEAAAALDPQRSVTAISNITTYEWLAVDETHREIHVEAKRESESRTRVEVRRADGAAKFAEAVVELSPAPLDLGPPQLPEVNEPPPPWDREELYGPILYHGPAFAGLETVEKSGPSGIQARVREPDPTLLFRDQPGRALFIPVVLIDTASSISGLANAARLHENYTRLLSFPNTATRIEFSPRVFTREPFVAVVRYDQEDAMLRSDTEYKSLDGQVVLRCLGLVQELVKVPAGLYAYAADPRRVKCSQDISHIFAGVPGSEQCAVAEVDRVDGRWLVHRHWCKVMAGIILSRSERQARASSQKPPVAAARWLLGRMVAKDAIRLHEQLELCMADISIESDAAGRPHAVLPSGPGPQVSLAHTMFYAVAAASRSLSGIGIDVTPHRPLEPVVIEDSFDERERALISRLPGGFAAAWAAKEAIGKALGTGLPGGPACIRLETAEVQNDLVGFSAALQGALANARPQVPSTGGGPSPLRAFSRIHREYVVALCLIP